jgi:hypothetical protein
MYPSKNTFLKISTVGGRNMWQDTLLTLREIYVFVCALVGFVSQDDEFI